MGRFNKALRGFFRRTGDWLVDCVKLTIFVRLSLQISMWRPPIIDQLVYDNLPSFQVFWDGLFIYWNLLGQLLLIISIMLMVLELQRQEYEGAGPV